MERPITIFYVYADTDEELRQKLDNHLALLRRQGMIAGWQQSLAGSVWEKEREQALNEASLILLLVSAEFINSHVCYEQQMQWALERERRGEVRVIPILLRPVDWKSAPFAHLQVLPTNGNPITSWNDLDAAFAQVAEQIRSLVEGKPLSEIQEKKEEVNATIEKQQSMQSPTVRERNSTHHSYPLTNNLLPTELSQPDIRKAHTRTLLLIGLMLLVITASVLGIFSFKKNTSSLSYAYDFEGTSTQGWDTTERSQKLAELHIVTDPLDPSNKVLEVQTKLSGSQYHEIDRHTEAKVYFAQGRPHGFVSPPPYNLQGKQVSCQVDFPAALAADRNHPPIIRMFVKDRFQRNDFEKPVEINGSIVGSWYEVSLKIGEYPEDEDQHFDGTSIIAIGMRIDVTPGSSLNYTGPFYIDKCIIPH